MLEEEVSGRGDSAQKILETGKYQVSLKHRKREDTVEWPGLPLAHQLCHALPTLHLSIAPELFHSVATYQQRPWDLLC